MTDTLPQTHAAAPETEPTPTPRSPIRVPYPVRIVLIIAATLFNLIVAPMILLIPLQLLYDPSWPENLAVALTLLTRIIPTLSSLGIVWLYMRHIDRRPFREAGFVFTAKSLPYFVVGIVGSLLAVLPAGMLLDGAGLLRPETDYVESISPLWTFLTAMVLGLLTQGFPEEFVWRGYGLQTMRYRPLVSVLVSGICFGSIHFFSQGGQQNVGEKLIYLTAALGFGLLAGMLSVALKSLWPAVGVHFGSHLAYYIASLFDMGTGPLLWILETTVYLVLCVLVYVKFREQFDQPIELAN